MSRAIDIEHRDHAVILRFIRPEIRNPLSIVVVEELQGILESVPVDCERLIFTGTGNVFASGADLREIAAIGPDEVKSFAERGQRLMNTIAALPCKTIAAINGFCFGGALDLAVSCDIRIAQPQAEFSHPGTGLGIITGWSGTQRLPRLIGQGRALEMFMTASRFDAATALRWGLVDVIADDAVTAALEINSPLPAFPR